MIRDNKRIITILTSLQNSGKFNTNIFATGTKVDDDRNSKIRSRVGSKCKKEKSKTEIREMSSSFRTVKRMNISGSTAAF